MACSWLETVLTVTEIKTFLIFHKKYRHVCWCTGWNQTGRLSAHLTVSAASALLTRTVTSPLVPGRLWPRHGGLGSPLRSGRPGGTKKELFRPARWVTPTQDHSWEQVDVTLCLLCHLARCTRSCCDGRKVSTWTDSRSPGCRLWLRPSVSRLLTLPGVAREEPRPPLEKLPGPPAPCAWPQLILYAPSRGLFKSNKSGGDFYLPSQVVLVVKNLPAHAGMSRDVGSIPGSERSPGEGNGNPFQ